MIIDKIENIHRYHIIPDYAAEFIKKLSAATPEGRYELQGKNYVNVETYQTKKISDAKFEAHNDYIDIQILLMGRENIYYTDRTKLTETAPYNNEKDIVFYKEAVKAANYVTIDGTNFVLIFPNEAHAPQAAISDIPQNVRKAVVKIHI